MATEISAAEVKSIHDIFTTPPEDESEAHIRIGEVWDAIAKEERPKVFDILLDLECYADQSWSEIPMMQRTIVKQVLSMLDGDHEPPDQQG